LRQKGLANDLMSQLPSQIYCWYKSILSRTRFKWKGNWSDKIQ